MNKLILFLIFALVLLVGCSHINNNQKISNKDIEVNITGEIVSFKYGSLECRADWKNKPGEYGSLTSKNVNINEKIRLDKGILYNLKFNKNLYF